MLVCVCKRSRSQKNDWTEVNVRKIERNEGRSAVQSNQTNFQWMEKQRKKQKEQTEGKKTRENEVEEEKKIFFRKLERKITRLD